MPEIIAKINREKSRQSNQTLLSRRVTLPYSPIHIRYISMTIIEVKDAAMNKIPSALNNFSRPLNGMYFSLLLCFLSIVITKESNP
jgi:hypothetical protein